MSACTAATRVVCHLDESNPGPSFQTHLKLGLETAVLIGPEGDFAPSEIAQAQDAGFTAVTLGAARLRTETAALAAVHIFALTNPEPHA